MLLNEPDALFFRASLHSSKECPLATTLSSISAKESLSDALVTR
jgi:hypothetical protein